MKLVCDCGLYFRQEPNFNLIWSFLQHPRYWEDLLLIRYNKPIHANKKKWNSIRSINRYKKTTSWKQYQICRYYQYLLSHFGNVKGRSYNGTLEFTFLGLLTEYTETKILAFKIMLNKYGFYLLAAFYCHFAEEHFQVSVIVRNKISSPKFKLSFLS